MIAIAVVASLVAYAWVMGYMNFQTAKTGQAIEIPSDVKGDDAGHMWVYVQNVGQGPVAVGSIYINDQLVSIDTARSDSVDIPEGNTAAFYLNLLADWNAGEEIQIKVTTTGGTFMEVKGTGSSSPTANPGQQQYTLTTNVENNEGGHVDRTPDASAYDANAQVEIEAVADNGWTFNHWSGSYTGNTNPLQIVMDSAKTITAVFTQNEYTLTVNTAGTGSGSVAKSPDQQKYHYGDEVQLTANPSDV